ncbi:hypothetical protein [Clostridium botulinum]|nr:hypothetical protein [Clostridium botulinum]MCD3335168.1 hypothetical protein [Clostridium botulinum D/C]MCD3352414.1 hypothetical protein [Clostridium botulinum D/C]
MEQGKSWRLSQRLTYCYKQTGTSMEFLLAMLSTTQEKSKQGMFSAV